MKNIMLQLWADLRIFDKYTGKNYTGLFCSKILGYSERSNIVYQVTPAQFAKIIYDVSIYTEE